MVVLRLGERRGKRPRGPGESVPLLLTVYRVPACRGRALVTNFPNSGPDAALAVGATIALAGLFALPVSGASMDPARSLGPAIMAGALSGAWVYVAGPVAGASLAVLLARLLHGPRQGGETEAASGERK